jgi:hypothetical protein
MVDTRDRETLAHFRINPLWIPIPPVISRMKRAHRFSQQGIYHGRRLLVGFCRAYIWDEPKPEELTVENGWFAFAIDHPGEL